MTRLKAALARLFSIGGTQTRATPPDGADAAWPRIGRQVTDLQQGLRDLNAQLGDVQQHADRLLAVERERIHDRASLAAIPRARLLAESIALDGTPSERFRVARVRVGEPVERPFSRWLGLARCVTPSADVRELWERLLAFEAECGDDVLRGLPGTILDVPGASAAIVGRTLRITPQLRLRQPAATLAVPRCTYDFPPRKLSNFGHWLLDCAPQIVALWKLAPDASFLLPEPSKEFHKATLALVGIDRAQLLPWDGSPVECSRLLAFENDGRTGGGRPLSPMMDMRRLLAPSEDAPARGTRRIYVSRRDARDKRQWMTNEAEVEEVFRSRGFDILVMRDCPLDEQVRLFREAGVVAGLNGAGLSDIVFSRPGTHVIVLLTDALIRWYADEAGSRSLWSGGRRGGAGRLSALGDSPRFWVHVAVTFEQPCHTFVGGDSMPPGELGRFVDDVLVEAGRG